MQTDLFSSQLGFLIFMCTVLCIIKSEASCNMFGISVSFYKVNSLNFWQIGCSFVSVTLICETDSEQLLHLLFFSLFKEIEEKVKNSFLRTLLSLSILSILQTSFSVSIKGIKFLPSKEFVKAVGIAMVRLSSVLTFR